MTALETIRSFSDDLVAMHRDFHENPEIGLQETRTAKIVATQLRDLGFEVHEGVGVTGVVGVLEGKKPGKTIGLRADMDALPLDEKTNLAWSSKNPGLMHACGHDGHTTMLLGAARYLSSLDEIEGKIVLIFQPAEEGLGGARAMIADGLFDRFPCDEIYALHNKPSKELGRVEVKTGVAYAGADFFDVRISGKGAHGAYPHEGTDVIGASSALIAGFNSIISRWVPAGERAVLSITKIEGGQAYNVLPDEVTMGGTIRFLSNATAELIRGRMNNIAEGVSRSHGVSVLIDFDQVFGVLNNDATCAAAVQKISTDVMGADLVHEIDTCDLGSEDFADMLDIVPGAYFTVGHDSPAPLHNPGFIQDEAMLPIGAALLSEIALTRSKEAG